MSAVARTVRATPGAGWLLVAGLVVGLAAVFRR
jgi:hypothetical protein